MGRWFGPIKVHGRRRGAEALRDALVGARLDLAAAARAGAELDPELVFRAFAYAIHPAWTKGHSFTVAQEIADPSPQRWHVLVRDGAPVAVERRATTAPDAVVTMTRATYLHLLRGERAPSGERPAIHCDRAAVALLRAWTERAQGQDA
jgi:alkyl sulfatase BDS1-like metallo-beta-lactamase superfamily hydrolase